MASLYDQYDEETRIDHYRRGIEEAQERQRRELEAQEEEVRRIVNELRTQPRRDHMASMQGHWPTGYSAQVGLVCQKCQAIGEGVKFRVYMDLEYCLCSGCHNKAVLFFKSSADYLDGQMLARYLDNAASHGTLSADEVMQMTKRVAEIENGVRREMNDYVLGTKTEGVKRKELV